MIVGQSQVFKDLATENGMLNDPGHIFNTDSAIPDGLRIDHHNRAKLALVQAARLIGSDGSPNTCSLQFDAKGITERLVAFKVTTATRMPWRSCISANENMVSKCWHAKTNLVVRTGNQGPGSWSVFKCRWSSRDAGLTNLAPLKKPLFPMYAAIDDGQPPP